MRTKTTHVTKIRRIFVAIFLSIPLIVSGIALPTNAESNKISVTDHDGDGTLSIGDEFCIGNECFYIISNDGTDVQALSKYNLKAGGDTFDVSANPKYSNVSNGQSKAEQYLNDYYSCNWDWLDDGNDEYYYGATRCYKRYDASYDTIDISNREDLTNISYNDFYTITQEIYDEGYLCVYDSEYRSGIGTFITKPYICYKKKPVTTTIKQDPEMLSAHNDASGKLIFPMRGNVYWSDGNYDIHNNLILSENYRQEYESGVNDYTTHTEISHYIYNYADLLKQQHDIKGINLLSYNDFMHILNKINKVGATFADDNYLIEDNEHFNWQEQEYDPGDPHGYTYWFASVLDYIPEQYNWLYSSTYWLSTGWYTGDETSYEPYEDEYGNLYRQQALNRQFFINTRGDLCSVNGYCGQMNIPAGIRPVITIAANQLQINTFNINGTVRWIDNDNSSNVRPDISVIRLYRNNVLVDTKEVTKDDDANLWRFSFSNLLKYDENGNEYVYTVTQDNIPLYSSDITDFNIVNRYTESSDVTPTPTPNKPIPNSPNTIDNIGSYARLAALFTAATAVIITLFRRRR